MLKLTCQLLPARLGMNLSPYLSFCGEFTGVVGFLGMRGCRRNEKMSLDQV